MEQLEKIKKAYSKINKILEPPYATKETRQQTINLIKSELPFIKNIICDETNNLPNIIDSNIIIARLEYDDQKNPNGFKYINLTFGDIDVTFTNV